MKRCDSGRVDRAAVAQVPPAVKVGCGCAPCAGASPAFGAPSSPAALARAGLAESLERSRAALRSTGGARGRACAPVGDRASVARLAKRAMGAALEPGAALLRAAALGGVGPAAPPSPRPVQSATAGRAPAAAALLAQARARAGRESPKEALRRMRGLGCVRLERIPAGRREAQRASTQGRPR